MLCTVTLFTIYYTRREQLQRRNDPNRIETIKSVMELEDADFVKMVSELEIDYDENDLRESVNPIKSKLRRTSDEGKAKPL